MNHATHLKHFCRRSSIIADDTPKSVVQAKEALKRLIDKRIEEEGIQGTVIDENIIDER